MSRSAKVVERLFHDAEIIICGCGHRAFEHHGVDQSPISGGCFGNGSGHAWSPTPKCPCVLTCPMVVGGES